MEDTMEDDHPDVFGPCGPQPGDPDQLLKDCLAGIIRDWTCISAGAASPWDGQEALLDRSDRLRTFVELKLRCRPLYDSLLIAAIMGYEEYLLQALVDRRAYEIIVDRRHHLMFLNDDALQLHIAQNQANQQNAANHNQPGFTGLGLGLFPLNVETSTPQSPRKRRRLLAADTFDAWLNPDGSLAEDGESGTTRKPNKGAVTRPPQAHLYVRTQKPIRRYRPHPARLPLAYTPGKTCVQFLSQLIPPSFEPSKRCELVNILRTGCPRVPSCWVYVNGKSQRLYFGTLRDNLRTLPPLPKVPMVTMSTNSTAVASGITWPGTSIPVEIFRNIISYLPREDIHSMRFVNHHFEQSVSEVIFRTVVVPFRPEIYGMVMASRASHRPQYVQGQDRAVAGPMVGGNGDFGDDSFGDAPFGIYGREVVPGAVINGMKVFQGWGARIKRFGFAFDVDEVILKNPPKKDTRESVRAFYGRYIWPHRNYSRFPLMAGLEKTADKTGDMTQALSYLSNMTELSLSLDGGLGWINGPDISDRAQIFSHKSKVYGVQNSVLDRAALGRLWRWGKISGSIKPLLSKLIEDKSIDQLSLAKYVELLSETEVLHDQALEFIGRYMKGNPVGHLKRLLKVGRSGRSVQQLINDHVRTVLCNEGIVTQTDYTTVTSLHGIEDLLRRKKTETRGNPCPQGLGASPNCDSRFWEKVRKRPSPMILRSDALRAIKAGGCRLASHLVNGGPEPYAFPDRNNPLQDVSTSGDQLMDAMDVSDEYPQEFSSEVDNKAVGRVVQTVLRDQAMRGEIEDDWSNVLASNLTKDGVDSSGVEGPLMIFNGVNVDSLPDITPTVNAHGPLKMKSAAPVQPRFLTTAQTEWLLETEWAQRAFLSSYVLGIVDNKPTFTNVTTLNFSKLSSRYLSLLDRPDLWEALKNLHTVTLMISPDWRDVKQRHPGLVETTPVAPSSAVDSLFNVLQHHVSPQETIKTLVVGYIGGGEHATGMFARNQHVLPAPIVDSSRHPKLLTLPYIRHLTFINCWFAPPALTAFMNEIKKEELGSVKFSSASLVVTTESASAFGTAENAALQVQSTWQDGLGFGVPRFRPGESHVPVPGATNATEFWPQFGWLKSRIRKDTWGSFINQFTPGCNLAEQRFAHKPSEDGSPPPQRNISSVVRLEFESCGYVMLPHQHADMLSVPGTTYDEPKSAYLIDRRNALYYIMMKSKDRFLGSICPQIWNDDEDVLTTAFHMRFGWGKDPKRFLNREDGQPEGGSGRFSGVIQNNAEQKRPWN